MSINNLKTSRLSTYLAAKNQPVAKDSAIDENTAEPTLEQPKTEGQQSEKLPVTPRKAIREPKPNPNKVTPVQVDSEVYPSTKLQ